MTMQLGAKSYLITSSFLPGLINPVVKFPPIYNDFPRLATHKTSPLYSRKYTL